jgi:glucose uptake protein GlcU
MAATTVGLIYMCAILSAIFNGSFAALFKTKKMVALDIHPMVFQLYACGGIFVSSWLVLPFLSSNPDLFQDDDDDDEHHVGDTFRLSGYGVVAGFLFVLAVSGSFNAVHDIGVALAQGIWAGGAMVVSYLWGLVVFNQVPSNVGLSFVGLLLLVVGVLGIALSDKIARHIEHTYRISAGGSSNESVPLRSEVSESSGERDPERYLRGVLWACSVGVSGGSILAPLHYVPPEKRGLIFLPSFGIGTLVLSPLVFYAYTFSTGTTPPPLHAKQALLTGLLSGLVWNIGNLLSIIAIPAIGYGVAYPIMQCAVLVSGMWGIYAFKEITDPSTIAVFWLGGAILILGGAVLAIAQ